MSILIKLFTMLFGNLPWKHHPEQQKGEVFISNVGHNREWWPLEEDGSAHIGWKTKRRGLVAYDRSNKPIKGMNPVFVQRKEMEEGGLDSYNLILDPHHDAKLFYLGLAIGLISMVIVYFLARSGVVLGPWPVIPFTASITLIAVAVLEKTY